MDSISLKVLFFAQAREQTKLTEGKVSIEIGKKETLTGRDLLGVIIENYPSLEPLQNCIILSKNCKYLDLESKDIIELCSSDEIAVIPPISSEEMDIIKLTPEVINVSEVSASVTAASCGAISMFIGTTRDNFEDKQVVRLEYEAYEPMAVTEIQKICTEIRSKWKVEHIAIYHRLGLVPVTEASIVIAISSEHRKESLEAVQYAIDTMKKTVPIWKKEVYEGSSNTEENQWKANKECFWVRSPNTEPILVKTVESVTDKQNGI